MDVALRCKNGGFEFVRDVCNKFPSELCIFLERFNFPLPGKCIGIDDGIDFF
jgi:hypothetical protein